MNDPVPVIPLAVIVPRMVPLAATGPVYVCFLRRRLLGLPGSA